MQQVQSRSTEKEADVGPTEASVPTEETIPKEYERQGRSCFGCLCDMRRAIIIMSGLGILSHVLSVISSKFWIIDLALEELEKMPGQQAEVDRLEQLFRIHFGVSLVGIVGYLAAIGGGLYFQQRLVHINVSVLWAVYTANTVLFFRAAGDIEELNFSAINVIGSTVGVVMSTFVHLRLVEKCVWES